MIDARVREIDGERYFHVSYVDELERLLDWTSATQVINPDVLRMISDTLDLRWQAQVEKRKEG